MFLVALLILSIVMARGTADPQLPKLFVNPPEYLATQLGEVFAIDINIADVQDLIFWRLKLGYNTSLLDALSTVAGGFPSTPPTLEIHEQAGYIYAYGWSPPAEGNGTLLTATFNVTYAEQASCTLDLYETILYNSTGYTIDHAVEDGNYTFVTEGFTVGTDKLAYLPGENITIYGNLTLGPQPFEGFVGLEIEDPGIPPRAPRRMICRTLHKGTPPLGNITIVDLYSCNLLGTPKENFTRNSMAYFRVTIHNNGNVTKNVVVTINTYDKDNAPFHVGSIKTNILGSTSASVQFPALVQPWTSLGNGTAYASVFTDYPRYGGTPYCPEKNDTFQITNGVSGGEGTPATQNQDGDGNYSLTFKLAPGANASSGIYRVWATTSYQESSATDKTMFGVNVIRVPYDYPTIQEAVDAATPTNKSIIVWPGTFNEHVTINKSVTLIGGDPSNTIINGSGTGTVVSVTADNVEVSRFTVQNGGSAPSGGIAINNSDSSTLSENIVLSNNGYGVSVGLSNNTDVLDNTLSKNYYGIYLNHSTNTLLRNNNMVCNKHNFGVFGDSLSDFTHEIDTSNTVDGKPVYYWLNRLDDQIPSDAGFVAIVSSARISVSDLDLTKNGQGILLVYSTDSLLERLNITNNEYGVYLFQSYASRIVGSEVANNTIGIYQSYCNENIIYRNNFINNTNQVALYQSSNTWDDGTGKGNHWSDYNGTDFDPPDGVGDEYLPWQGVDWYPLMDPWVPMHDTAITNVTFALPCDETHLYPGWVINVTGTVQNEGDFTEIINVTAYYDENPIETKTVSGLGPLDQIGISFAWDTQDVSPGNYTLSAEVGVLPNETDTTDNTYVDGNITLLVPTVYDVAITNVTPVLPYNTSHVYASWVIDIIVAVRNEGHSKETLNVTAYYDGNLIEMKTVTLYPLANTTLTLTWDTTEVAPGINYTISASVPLVQGEVDTSDNTLMDGQIYVRMSGDVNDDGGVDGGDQIKVGNALWSVPGEARYNPYADVNMDFGIDGGDQIVVGNNLWGGV